MAHPRLCRWKKGIAHDAASRPDSLSLSSLPFRRDLGSIAERPRAMIDRLPRPALSQWMKLAFQWGNSAITPRSARVFYKSRAIALLPAIVTEAGFPQRLCRLLETSGFHPLFFE